MQTLILPVTHAILGIICQLRYDIPQACPVLSKPGAFGRVATVKYKCKYKYKYEYIIYIGPPEVDIQCIGPEGNISAEA